MAGGRKRRAACVFSPVSTRSRETVWIPELMKHANGTKRLKQVLISFTGAGQGCRPSRGYDRPATPRTEPDGTVAVPSGSDRADLVIP